MKALAEEERGNASPPRPSASVCRVERKSNADADRAAEAAGRSGSRPRPRPTRRRSCAPRRSAARSSCRTPSAERLATGPRSPLKGSKVLETVGDAAAEIERMPSFWGAWRAPRRRRRRGAAPAPRRGRASRGARFRNGALVQCPGGRPRRVERKAPTAPRRTSAAEAQRRGRPTGREARHVQGDGAERAEPPPPPPTYPKSRSAGTATAASSGRHRRGRAGSPLRYGWSHPWSIKARFPGTCA